MPLGANKAVIMGAAAGDLATGGIITYHGSYKVHTFITTGDFVVSGNLTVDALIVGGGGSGGNGDAGSSGHAGGGGGALRTATSQALTART
jgi:hypothetical protein